jgi:hypothetical protein
VTAACERGARPLLRSRTALHRAASDPTPRHTHSPAPQWFDDCEPAVAAAAAAGVEALRRLGAEVVRVALPELEAVRLAHTAAFMTEGLAFARQLGVWDDPELRGMVRARWGGTEASGHAGMRGRAGISHGWGLGPGVPWPSALRSSVRAQPARLEAPSPSPPHPLTPISPPHQLHEDTRCVLATAAHLTPAHYPLGGGRGARGGGACGPWLAGEGPDPAYRQARHGAACGEVQAAVRAGGLHGRPAARSSLPLGTPPGPTPSAGPCRPLPRPP